MVEYTKFESLLVNFLNNVPYVILFLYAFNNNFRFSKKVTFALITLFTFIIIASNELVRNASGTTLQIYTYLLFLMLVLFAFVIVKTSAGRILFLAIMLKNCADFIVIISKFLEHLIWPEESLLVYHWTYAISMFICEAFFLSIVAIIIKKHFVANIISKVSSYSWHFLWIVPLFFYYTWVYVFYLDDVSSLEAAFIPQNNIFLLSAFVCQLLIYTWLAIMIEKSQESVSMMEQISAHERQFLQYENISLKIEQASMLRHDLRHHLILISSYIENNDLDSLKEYLDLQVGSTSIDTSISYCSNVALNILLVYYADKCKESGIDFLACIDIAEDIVLNDYETTVLFGNLIENAFESCMKQAPAKASIKVICKMIQNNLVISIENTIPPDYAFQPSLSPGKFASSKRSDDGIGTQSCRDIVSRYSGTITFNCSDAFTVDVMLPMQS